MEQGQPLQRKIPEAGASSGQGLTWGLESFGQNMGTGGFQEQFLAWDVSGYFAAGLSFLFRSSVRLLMSSNILQETVRGSV